MDSTDLPRYGRSRLCNSDQSPERLCLRSQLADGLVTLHIIDQIFAIDLQG
jgi:hypothetical protein